MLILSSAGVCIYLSESFVCCYSAFFLAPFLLTGCYIYYFSDILPPQAGRTINGSDILMYNFDILMY